MTTISNNTPVYHGMNYTPRTDTPENPDDDNKKIVIEVTPGEDNVTSGDRSNNTININISTPNREIEAEISRSQVADVLKKRTYLKAVSGNNGTNTLTKAYVAKNSDIDSDDLAQRAYLSHKQNQINVYSQGTSNTHSTNSSSGQDNSSNTAAYQYNEAKKAMNRHAFIAGIINRSS